MDLTKDLVRRFMLYIHDLLSSGERIVGLRNIHRDRTSESYGNLNAVLKQPNYYPSQNSTCHFKSL